MEPYKLRRWKKASNTDSIALYTCARPGRSAGPNGVVSDSMVLRWIAGLPGGDSGLSLISLLGQKPDGTDEHSFYSFKTAAGFHGWLKQHSPKVVFLFEHPTTDFRPVCTEQCSAIGKQIDHELSLGRTVVMVDSGGVQRSSQVCRNIGLLEDTRSS